MKAILDHWLSRHEVPAGHPVEPSYREVLRDFYAMILVGTGLELATPELVLGQLLPGVQWRGEDRPSEALAKLGLCRGGVGAQLHERLRASLSSEQAARYLALVA